MWLVGGFRQHIKFGCFVEHSDHTIGFYQVYFLVTTYSSLKAAGGDMMGFVIICSVQMISLGYLCMQAMNGKNGGKKAGNGKKKA